MLRIRSLAVLPSLVLAAGLGAFTAPASAQEGEPLLAQARSIFNQPAMRLRFLARINADAGLEDARTRFVPSQARIRLEGDLDGRGPGRLGHVDARGGRAHPRGDRLPGR